MKVDYYPYSLVPKSTIGSVSSSSVRNGALIRWQIQDQVFGYSDCHPWPELGDIPLLQQLELLRTGNWTPLIRRSWKMGMLDGTARLEKKSLWEEVIIPPSHALITDLFRVNLNQIQVWNKAGFTRVKIKLGKNLTREVQILILFLKEFQRRGMKVRLDFNSCLSLANFEWFLETLGNHIETIDFIEDPFPYHSQDWTRIQNQWGVRLALDRISPYDFEKLDQVSFSVLILKPAIQDPEIGLRLVRRFSSLSLVVTSYLDHPIGQLGAAWVASNLASQARSNFEGCGLLSHEAYEADLFSQELKKSGPTLVPPSGLGLGFDQSLENLNWKSMGDLSLADGLEH